MFADFSAAAMELGEVLGLQGLTVPSTKEGDLSLIKRAAAGSFTQAAAASYPSPFLDEQKMLRFAKAAHTLPSVSWRPLYQGFPNADSDPEPGRCHRTDGKKWRCSKEAMADHKYCERHINRNRHRSRKPLLNLKNQQPTLSLFSQLKQPNKPEKFRPAGDCESISSNTMLKPWESSNQQNNKNIPFTKMHDRGCLQSVLQNFSLPKDEKMEFQKNKDSNVITVPSTFYSSPDGPRVSCHTPNMAQMQEDSISSSWEMPQGGPLGEILTNSKNTDDSIMKPEARPYGWLLNLEDHAM